MKRLALLVVLALPAAAAHDHNHPELEGWYRGLYSKDKTWCCNGDDAEDVEEYETKGDHYRVKMGGRWIDVPADKVIEEANKARVPKVWPDHVTGGVRCFIPGELT